MVVQDRGTFAGRRASSALIMLRGSSLTLPLIVTEHDAALKLSKQKQNEKHSKRDSLPASAADLSAHASLLALSNEAAGYVTVFAVRS